jgi:peptidoglycan/LPS O-acetylase OafA/YrhL
MTLREALDANRGVGPGFHFMRHALSIMIVLFHCRAAVVYWPDSTLAVPHLALPSTGTGAEVAPPLSLFAEDFVRPFFIALLATFFALSGFLVTGSGLRTKKIRTFFANRALRIIPALSVEVTMSAIIIGPIFTTMLLKDYFSDPQFFRYFGNIIGVVTFELPGVFKHLPWPSRVNGNLWTLPPEFWCYALMMIVMIGGFLRRKIVLLVALTALLTWMTIENFIYPVSFIIRFPNFYSPFYIVVMFWIGAVFFLFAERIPIHFGLFTASATAYYLSIMLNVLTPLSGVALTYCMVYLGMQKFGAWDRLVKFDLSYGIYLYGFPIMQAWVSILLPHFAGWSTVLRVLLLFPLTLATTIAFAALSWRFIEKPALGLRSVFLRTEPVKT